MFRNESCGTCLPTTRTQTVRGVASKSPIGPHNHVQKTAASMVVLGVLIHNAPARTTARSPVGNVYSSACTCKGQKKPAARNDEWRKSRRKRSKKLFKTEMKEGIQLRWRHGKTSHAAAFQSNVSHQSEASCGWVRSSCSLSSCSINSSPTSRAFSISCTSVVTCVACVRSSNSSSTSRFFIFKCWQI